MDRTISRRKKIKKKRKESSGKKKKKREKKAAIVQKSKYCIYSANSTNQIDTITTVQNLKKEKEKKKVLSKPNMYRKNSGAFYIANRNPLCFFTPTTISCVKKLFICFSNIFPFCWNYSPEKCGC